MISFTVAPHAASSRSRTATAIPSSASLRAVAAPMPRAEPVTIAILSVIGLLLLSGNRPRARVGAAELTAFVLSLNFYARGFRRLVALVPLSLSLSPLTRGLPQLAAGQGPLVHLVRAVGEPERAGAGPQVGQREVLADPAAAVGLDRLVDHPLGHPRRDDLDRLDLAVRPLVPDGVHQPRRLEHEQPRLLDAHPRLGDPVLDDALLGQGLAEGDPAGGTAAHQLKSALGRADLAHAVVDAAGAEPGLGDREPHALAGDHVLARHPDVVEDDLG